MALHNRLALSGISKAALSDIAALAISSCGHDESISHQETSAQPQDAQQAIASDTHESYLDGETLPAKDAAFSAPGCNLKKYWFDDDEDNFGRKGMPLGFLTK